MFRAVREADASYDGVFFFGVTSTGVFCFPSCNSRTPRRENVVFFRSREEALAAGFRPCKRCRPDLGQGRRSYEVDLVVRAQALVEEQLECITVGGLASALAISPNHLRRLFRRWAGVPVHEYIVRRRVLRAAGLLRASRLSVLDVAGAVGFESSSAFYAAFQRVLGVAPGEYRRGGFRDSGRHVHRV